MKRSHAYIFLVPTLWWNFLLRKQKTQNYNSNAFKFLYAPIIKYCVKVKTQLCEQNQSLLNQN